MKKMLFIIAIFLSMAGIAQKNDTILCGKRGQLIWDPIAQYSFMLENGAIIDIPDCDTITKRMRREYSYTTGKLNKLYTKYFRIVNNMYLVSPGKFWANVNKRNECLLKINKYKPKQK